MKWFGGCALGVALLLTPASAREADAPKASELWLVPARSSALGFELATAVQQLADGRPAPAAGVFAKAVDTPVIGDYARLYEGRANLALGQIDSARKIAKHLLDHVTAGYGREAVLLFAADTADAAADPGGVVHDLSDLLELKPSSASALWLRLGRAAVQAGDREKAVNAFNKDYFDYPLSDESVEAAKALAAPGMPGTEVTRDTYSHAKARAAALFDGRRFAEARKAFDALRPFAKDDDAELIALRDAECDLNAKKYANAMVGLAPLASAGAYQTEARFNTLAGLRGLNKGDEYVGAVRSFVASNPTSPYAESALNDLGSYFTTSDDDAKAADVFAEMYRVYPDGVHAERAAWQSGWWAFKGANYDEAARTFDDASVRMAHADTRPSWLYWAAKAHLRAGDRDGAIEGFRKTIANYRNLYYGREAARELKLLAVPVAAAKPGASTPAPEPLHVQSGEPPANAQMITRLLEAGMWDEALGELRYAERASGATPLIQATQAYVWGKKGDLRTGITLMKRAYPQFMSASGAGLPDELEKVIYPVAYWDLITKYASAHKLDPSIMAALIAQESTFQPDIKSGANAWGLMQILPSTGRQYANHIGIAPFSTQRLTEPLVNIRIGMAYFADLVKQFGSLPAALASYNAGESRAIRWLKERPGLPRDEFIDDIPFPETQGYVRRIIGTAEDYRRLYGAAR